MAGRPFLHLYHLLLYPIGANSCFVSNNMATGGQQFNNAKALTTPLTVANIDNGEALNRSCQSALSWSTLKSIILSSDLVKLARSEEQKLTYRRGREAIHNEWDSIYDYLLCVKFGFEEIVNQQTGKKSSEPTFETLECQWRGKSCPSHRMVLSLNDYPYYLEHGIEHWILWKLGGQDVDLREIERAKLKILCQCVAVNCEDDGIEMLINSSLPTTTHLSALDMEAKVQDDSIFLHWVNPPHLKR